MPAAVATRQAGSHAVARAPRLAPVTHLASGGIVGAGAAVLQIAIAEEVQALDSSVTPYVGVSLQCVGSAPALLAATGTVALLSDDDEPETLAALRSVVQTPLVTDAASLALPLAAGHAFRLEEATVGVTGAAGDWGSANQWLGKVNSGGGRDDDRGPLGPCARPRPGVREGRRQTTRVRNSRHTGALVATKGSKTWH